MDPAPDDPTLSPPLRHGYVTAAGLRLHHLDFSTVMTPERAAPVVLVHGVTGHAMAWCGVAPKLAPIGRPIAVDLRGHGASQWASDGDYATTTHAADLLAVLDALGIARASFVGSSWGALVALAFAVQHPTRVERLALVDIEPSFSQSETDVAPRPRTFASSAEVLAFERTRNPNAPGSTLACVAAASVRPGPDGLVPCFDPVFHERWPFRGDDWWEALATVRAPALVVHAGRSFVRREVTEQMATVLANGRHIEIVDSTHVVPVDAPDALARVLVAFLGGD